MLVFNISTRNFINCYFKMYREGFEPPDMRQLIVQCQWTAFAEGWMHLMRSFAMLFSACVGFGSTITRKTFNLVLNKNDLIVCKKTKSATKELTIFFLTFYESCMRGWSK